jgi:carboxymethylenebutenolidase
LAEVLLLVYKMNADKDELSAMNAKTIDIKTRDGLVPCHFFAPPQKGSRPAVLFYMDGIGIRPALRDMAERLASNGYNVLLPNLYYRSGPSAPFDAVTAFKEGPERDRLMKLFQSLNNKLVMDDTASFLDFLEHQPTVASRMVGCVGYCLGGAFALSAAGTFTDRIAAAASLHGARLATDQPDSPHLLASKMRAAIYVGIAGIDPHFTPEEKQRLESAFQSAGVKSTVETYPDVKHGFAVNDTPAYDRPASELHWQQILKLFARLA